MCNEDLMVYLAFLDTVYYMPPGKMAQPALVYDIV